jgi:hypothetical protein
MQSLSLSEASSNSIGSEEFAASCIMMLDAYLKS